MRQIICLFTVRLPLGCLPVLLCSELAPCTAAPTIVFLLVHNNAFHIEFCAVCTVSLPMPIRPTNVTSDCVATNFAGGRELERRGQSSFARVLHQ